MWFKRLSILATIMTVAGCQSLPQPSEKKACTMCGDFCPMKRLDELL